MVRIVTPSLTLLTLSYKTFATTTRHSAPELVAEAILHCAENPTRDFLVGGMAKVHSSMGLNTPRLHEKMNESMIDTMRFVLEHSLYQRAKPHPVLTASIAVSGGVALAAWLGSRASSSPGFNAS